MLKPLFSMGSAVMSSPLYSIVPASASTSPRIRFKSVVFPQPEGPRMETISPSPISRLIFSRTVRPSYVFFKFSSFNIPFSFLFPCFVLRLIIATECIKKRYVKPRLNSDKVLFSFARGRERCDRNGHAVFLRPGVDFATTGSEITGISTSSTKLK